MEPLQVLLTVDTEVYPKAPDWRETALRDDFQTYVYGVCGERESGIRHQIETLNRYGLRAVFFVEPLYSLVAGPERLRETVAVIQDGGHEVQLHLHAEWHQWLPPDCGLDWPEFQSNGNEVRDYSLDGQLYLLGHGLELLRAAGATDVTAFRAGNYGANFDTLRALARLGLRYDSSYNLAYMGGRCQLTTPEPLIRPTLLHNVWEVPVNFFRDRPNHIRPTEFMACSAAELRHTLGQAWRRGLGTYVTVWHGHEFFVKNGRRDRLDDRLLKRFGVLCQFLAKHTDRFRTTGFNDLHITPAVAGASQADILRSSLLRTAGRYCEQLARKAQTRLS